MVMGIDVVILVRAGGVFIHPAHGQDTIGGAMGNIPDVFIGPENVLRQWNIVGLLVVLQSPDFLGAYNLNQAGSTGISSPASFAFHKVGKGDGRDTQYHHQESQTSNHDPTLRMNTWSVHFHSRGNSNFDTNPSPIRLSLRAS